MTGSDPVFWNFRYFSKPDNVPEVVRPEVVRPNNNPPRSTQPRSTAARSSPYRSNPPRSGSPKSSPPRSSPPRSQRSEVVRPKKKPNCSRWVVPVWAVMPKCPVAPTRRGSDVHHGNGRGGVPLASMSPSIISYGSRGDESKTSRWHAIAMTSVVARDRGWSVSRATKETAGATFSTTLTGTIPELNSAMSLDPEDCKVQRPSAESTDAQRATVFLCSIPLPVKRCKPLNFGIHH